MLGSGAKAAEHFSVDFDPWVAQKLFLCFGRFAEGIMAPADMLQKATLETDLYDPISISVSARGVLASQGRRIAGLYIMFKLLKRGFVSL